MSTRTPIVRQISWPAAIFQFLLLALLMGGAFYVYPPFGAIFVAAGFLTYTLAARSLVPWHHRAGVRHYKRRRFREAISCFEKSLQFFERHSWIDRYRAIVLLSASAVSYQEMALANMGFCHSQSGDGKQARRCYEECLKRFPDSGIAFSALRMMDSAVGRGE